MGAQPSAARRSCSPARRAGRGPVRGGPAARPAGHRHRRPSGPPTRCCTPPGWPPSRCAAGLTPTHRGQGGPAPAGPGGRGRAGAGRRHRAARPRRARAAHHREQLAAAAAAGRHPGPLDASCARRSCPATASTARSAARWSPRCRRRPARAGALVALADGQPAPGPGAGHPGDGPLGRHPARPGRAGLVPGPAGPGRGAGAAGADQPALHLQRADRDRARSSAPTRSGPAS